MEIQEYIVTVKHDGGSMRILTYATSAETAKRLVANAENAPLSAIVNVKVKG